MPSFLYGIRGLDGSRSGIRGVAAGGTDAISVLEVLRVPDMPQAPKMVHVEAIRKGARALE